MLTTTLLHPEILHALARAGHGSRILIADGNYHVGTTLGKNSALVHLNLRPDMLTVDEILEALLTAIVVEEATVMTPARGLDVRTAHISTLGADVVDAFYVVGRDGKLTDEAERAGLRDALLARGVAVEDTRDGQRWRLLVGSGG